MSIGINFALEIGGEKSRQKSTLCKPLGLTGGGGIYQFHAAVIKSVFSPKDTVMISHFSRQELVVVVVVVVEWFRCDISLL